MLIINKTDLAGDEQVASVRAWVDSHLNRVRIVETSHCVVPLEILLGVGRFHPQQANGQKHLEQASSDHGAVFDRWSWETDQPMSLSRLQEMVKTQLPAGVYRCKGVVHSGETPDQRSVLQVVGRRCEMIPERPWHDQTPTTRIVAIGSPGQIDRERLKTLFERCIADRQLEETAGLPGVTTARI